MLIRALLFLIPVLTFVIPQRWFSYYVTLLITVSVYELFLFVFVSEETKAAYGSFGAEAVFGYIGINLLLLAVRYALIRRTRARTPKLPAPNHDA